MEKTDWKSKAKENALDKKQLRKRLKELTKSRDDWKSKAISHKERADKLESRLKKTKNRLNVIMELE